MNRNGYKIAVLTILFLHILTSSSYALFEKRSFNNAAKKNTVESYQLFLEKYPESDFRSEAEKRLEELIYSRAVQEGTAASYQTFLVKYPESRFRKEIEERLLDLTFYEKAVFSNTVRAYREYLSKSPSPYKKIAAHEQIKTLEFEFYTKVNTLWGYEYFLKTYPEPGFIEQVKKKMELLRYEQVKDEDTIAFYEMYLSEYPSGSHAGEAQKRLKELQKERAVYEPFTDKDTLKAYLEFVGNSPLNAYIPEAKARISTLKIQKVFSNTYKHVPDPVVGERAYSKTATFYFRNETNYPVTFYLSGSDSLYETFEPGESGALKFLAGKQSVVVQVGVSPETLWAGTFSLYGDYLVYLDSKLKSIGIFGVHQGRGKYNTDRMRRSAHYRGQMMMPPIPTASPELFDTYNKEVKRLMVLRDERVATAYPLKRVVTLKQLMKLKRSTNKSMKRVAIFAMREMGSREAMRALLDMLGDQDVNMSVTEVLDTYDEAIWPLIALIKEKVESHSSDLKNITQFRLGVVGGFEMAGMDRTAMTAIKSLVKLKKGVADALVESFMYCDGYTLPLLLAALGEIADSSHEEIFLEALKEETPGFKYAGVTGLVDIATEKSIKPLLHILLDKNQRFINKSALRALRNAASKGDLRIRITPVDFKKYLSIYDDWDKYFYSYPKPSFFLTSVPRDMIDDSVFSMLKSEDKTTWSILCDMLSKNGVSKDVDLLLECLKKENFGIQEKALEGLVRIKNERTIDFLLDFIKGVESEQMRKKAAHSLGSFGTEKAVEKLVELFEGYEREEYKRLMIEALGKTRSKSAAEFLVSLFKHSEQYKRYNSGRALHELGVVAIPSLNKLLDHPDETVRILTIICLQNIHDQKVMDVLYEALKDGNPRVRKAAVEGLYLHEMYFENHDAPYHLHRALTDDEVHNGEIIEFLKRKNARTSAEAIKKVFLRDLDRGRINYSAIEALSFFGEKEVLRKATLPVIEELKQGDGSKDWKYLKALKEISDERAVEVLVERMDTTSVPDLKWIISALSETKSPKATLPLLELMNKLKDDSTPFVKGRVPQRVGGSAWIINEKKLLWVIDALGEIGDPRAIDPIVSMLENERMGRGSSLHERVLEALSNIGGPKVDRVLVEEFNAIKENYARYERKMFWLSQTLSKIQSEEVVNDLVSIFRAGDTNAKEQVIRSLENIKGEKAARALRDIAIFSNNFSEAAARSLGNIGEQALDDLLELVYNVERSKIRAVIRAIGEIKSKKVITPLLQAKAKIGSLVDESILSAVVANFPEFFIQNVSLSDTNKKLPSSKVN